MTKQNPLIDHRLFGSRGDSFDFVAFCFIANIYWNNLFINLKLISWILSGKSTQKSLSIFRSLFSGTTKIQFEVFLFAKDVCLFMQSRYLISSGWEKGEKLSKSFVYKSALINNYCWPVKMVRYARANLISISYLGSCRKKVLRRSKRFAKILVITK